MHSEKIFRALGSLWLNNRNADYHPLSDIRPMILLLKPPNPQSGYVIHHHSNHTPKLTSRQVRAHRAIAYLAHVSKQRARRNLARVGQVPLRLHVG